MVCSGSTEVRSSESVTEKGVMMGCRWKNGKGNRWNAAGCNLSAPLQSTQLFLYLVFSFFAFKEQSLLSPSSTETQLEIFSFMSWLVAGIRENNARCGPWCVWKWAVACENICSLLENISSEEKVIETLFLTYNWLHTELQNPAVFWLFQCPSGQRGNWWWGQHGVESTRDHRC